MDNCRTYKPKTGLNGPLLGFRVWPGSVIDGFAPVVDTCHYKYMTISELEIPEPNIEFQLGESY